MNTPRTVRRQQADQRRAQLIDAALSLFAERGFRATTIADIADATGTAHGLVYHYFASKDELLAAVLERYSFLPDLQGLLEVSSDRPAAEVLTRIAVGLSEVLGRRPELVRLVVSEAHTNPAVAAALDRVTSEGLDAMTGYLQARIDAGELRPHDTTVPARALFWAVITKHLGPAEADGFERDLVDVLLDGIRSH
jgi:AcrR family transcriptional regulator